VSVCSSGSVTKRPGVVVVMADPPLGGSPAPET
jgi:hypothetical protein